MNDLLYGWMVVMAAKGRTARVDEHNSWAFTIFCLLQHDGSSRALRFGCVSVLACFVFHEDGGLLLCGKICHICLRDS
jgi:hypothetical protein